VRKRPHAAPQFKDFVRTLVWNARGEGGSKREEESCGAGTGMQMYPVTGRFPWVGVRSVGGQVRGTLT